MRWRQATAAGACVLALVGLTGCASVAQFFKADDAPSAEQPPRPVVRVYRLEVDAPGELRTLLDTYLDLARFQSAPESEDITPAEVDRLIAAAEDLADIEAAKGARAELAAGEDSIPWDQVKADLGLA